VRRVIYSTYRGILYVEHCGKIYLHKILRNIVCWVLREDLFTQNTEEYFMLSTVGRFIYTNSENTLCLTLWEDLFTQNTGEYFVEHNGNFDLHTILGITLCWALWEDLFTQNTEEYFMLSTVRRFIYTKYCILSTVGRFIYTKYWGILYVEHCGKIYLHTIPRNTLCWTLWEDLFTQNTEEYFMLSTVGRFIYTKYW
jgi:hypothetical protein